MAQHLETRADGSYRLFIDGDLQFDTRDERLYHEMLALPALCLARPMVAEDGLRVLICGGGDGLALRECLRFSRVTSVDLVDYDPAIVEMGKVEFAAQNDRAFHDERARVHIMDAWEFLQGGDLYDVIILDFTVPRKPDEVRIFTREWYERVASCLAPDGVLAINGVSPQLTTEAFWCLNKTVKAAGLSVLPYRCCIPSFRDQGYGAWAFLLAAHRPLTVSMLRHLNCPVPTHLSNLKTLWKAAQFTRTERQIEARVPVHALDNPCYLPLLLNAGLERDAAEIVTSDDEPYSLEPLMRAIPILHPYHTREMIEILAGQVVGSVRALDITRLIDALLARASRLTDGIVAELHRLREFLTERLPAFDLFRRWAHRLFALLIVFMTLANVIAPDNAFAKGSAGLGHASMSRGYTGGYRGSGGSFGGVRGSGGSFSAGRVSGGSFRSTGVPRSSSIRSTGFRSSVRTRGQSVDIYGNAYAPRVYVYHGYGGGYYHGYYGGGVGHRPPANTPPPQQHQAAFVADEDMLVMDNGDVIITLSDKAYLLVNNGTVALFHQKLPDPLLPLAADPVLFQSIREQLQEQKAMAEGEIRLREEWLSWVSWSSALFPTVRADKAEVRELRDLMKRLDLAMQRLGQPRTLNGAALPTGAVELFVGGFLTPDRQVQFRQPDGSWLYTDGKQVWSAATPTKRTNAPAELGDALQSILTKLEKELNADLQADSSYLRELVTGMQSLQRDKVEYTNIAARWGYSDTVDYGTEEISCQEALNRTDDEIALTQQEYKETLESRLKTARELETIQRVWLGNSTYTAPPITPEQIMVLPGGILPGGLTP
jgi:spermidine synthase